MNEILVRGEIEYPVRFISSLAEITSELPEDHEVVAVTTEKLEGLFDISTFFPNPILMPDGESQKAFRNIERLMDEFATRGLTRNSLILAIGGGATTDLVGFAASIYMRGIDWIAVPTSLAGMVDASIGGKTGINISAGKNLVGSFHSPRAVYIMHSFLEDLPERDLKAGLAEVVKCGFIADPEILELIKKDYEDNLRELIYRAIAVKARVVSLDFKEQGEREVLNYGHTLGHAIEAHSKFELRHGEAISIGLVFAAELAKRFGSLSNEEAGRHRAILEKLRLPTRYEKNAWPELFPLMKNDKKRRGAGIRFVILRSIGKTERIDSLSEADLRSIYDDVIAE